jgi:hypothetical protein
VEKCERCNEPFQNIYGLLWHRCAQKNDEGEFYSHYPVSKVKEAVESCTSKTKPIVDAVVDQMNIVRGNNRDINFFQHTEYEECERLYLDYHTQVKVVNCLLSRYPNAGFDGNELAIQEFIRLAEIAEEIEREAAAHNIH